MTKSLLSLLFLTGQILFVKTDCETNADCILKPCENPDERSYCDNFMAWECACMTYEAYVKNVQNTCQEHCRQQESTIIGGLLCPGDQERICSSFDPDTNNPRLTFQCKCAPASCTNRVSCLCGDGTSENCVNNHCVCEKCTGTCNDPDFKCTDTTKVPAGCPSGECGCTSMKCETKEDCPSCSLGIRRVCNKLYSDPGFCSGCLLERRCVVNSDCSNVGQCCVKVAGVDQDYGTCLDSDAVFGCPGGSSGWKTIP